MADSEGYVQAVLWQNGRAADLGSLVDPEWPLPELPEFPGWEELIQKETAAIDITDQGTILGSREQLVGPRAVITWNVSPRWDTGS